MTITVNFSSVADSISNLSITGVSVLDIDKILSSYTARPALLAPRPEKFVTDFSITPASMGSGSGKQLDLKYTLNYVYYHCQIGSTLNFASYSAMITNIAAILVALLTNDTITGAVDLQVAAINDIGPVLDPAGNSYFGCTISVQITQLIN